jgi:hypothetical protein
MTRIFFPAGSDEVRLEALQMGRDSFAPATKDEAQAGAELVEKQIRTPTVRTATGQKLDPQLLARLREFLGLPDAKRPAAEEKLLGQVQPAVLVAGVRTYLDEYEADPVAKRKLAVLLSRLGTTAATRAALLLFRDAGRAHQIIGLRELASRADPRSALALLVFSCDKKEVGKGDTAQGAFDRLAQAAPRLDVPALLSRILTERDSWGARREKDWDNSGLIERAGRMRLVALAKFFAEQFPLNGGDCFMPGWRTLAV